MTLMTLLVTMGMAQTGDCLAISPSVAMVRSLPLPLKNPSRMWMGWPAFLRYVAMYSVNDHGVSAGMPSVQMSSSVSSAPPVAPNFDWAGSVAFMDGMLLVSGSYGFGPVPDRGARGICASLLLCFSLAYRDSKHIA